MGYKKAFSIVIFFCLIIGFIIFWTRMLVGERSKFKNVLSIYLASWLGIDDSQQAYALLISLTYYSFAIMASIVVALCFQINLFALFTIRISDIPFIVLGLIAELSGVGFSGNLVAYMLYPKADIRGEIKSVSWIKGISQLPPRLIRFAPGGGAFVEELFFRGAVLSALIKNYSLSPYLALFIVTLLFVYEQVLLTQSIIQRLVIGISSAAISFIGGLLLFYTGSIIPSIVAHCAFVVFYVGDNKDIR